MASDVSKMNIRDAMYVMGWSIERLARESGIDVNTVRRAVLGGKIKTNYTSAHAIARALGVKVSDLEWPSGLTEVGRPAQTGRPMTHVRHDHEQFCPTHHLQLSRSGECSLCA